MKKKRFSDDFEYEQKPLNTPLAKEQKAGGFRCSHCRTWVVINPYIGTANRNHCNWCLWSRHVDVAKGDRMADCRGGMRPIALTYKHEGYGRTGELMLVHYCQGCCKLSINRIAADDDEAEILRVFAESFRLEPQVRRACAEQAIKILGKEDETEVRTQLFGVQ